MAAIQQFKLDILNHVKYGEFARRYWVRDPGTPVPRQNYSPTTQREDTNRCTSYSKDRDHSWTYLFKD